MTFCSACRMTLTDVPSGMLQSLLNMHVMHGSAKELL